MKTEYKLAEELKIMMSEMSLDDISVSLLTKRCKINNPQMLIEAIFNY